MRWQASWSCANALNSKPYDKSRNARRIRMGRDMRWLHSLLLLVIIASPWVVSAQTRPDKPYYSRVNSFGVFAAYANDSSHILLGSVENRKLLNFGASYSRRLAQGHLVNWQYNVELMPVAL